MSARAILLRAGVLHDSAGGAPQRNVNITIEGDRITAIGHEGHAHADIIEAPCVVPGLVNAHAHLEMNGEPQTTLVILSTTSGERTIAAVANARRSLHAGVTTIRELGSTGNVAVEVRDAVNRGEIPGPTIVAAGNALCMTGGHGWFVGRETDGPWDARKAVREQLKRGADCIKLIATGGVLTKGAVPGIAQLTEEEMTAAITEARNHGMRVAAHAIGLEGIKNALRAGVTSIEHGHLLDDEALELFKTKGAYLVPTLCAVTRIVEAGPQGGMPDYVVRKANELFEKVTTNITRAFRAGITIAGGSDAGTPFNYHDDYAHEVALMQRLLGMSAQQALRAATATSAELLDRPDRGTIEIGKRADLLVLRSDIEADITALREPLVVIQAGKIAIDRRHPAT